MVFSNGSIADIIFSGITPFPLSVSGVLLSLVNNAIRRVENYTGDTLGLTGIADKYSPAVTNLGTSNVLNLMAVQDNGVQSVTIGELSTNNNNLKEISAMFEEMGNMELKALSKGIKFWKARGM